MYGVPEPAARRVLVPHLDGIVCLADTAAPARRPESPDLKIRKPGSFKVKILHISQSHQVNHAGIREGGSGESQLRQ
jgi:hypothetical protein